MSQSIDHTNHDSVWEEITQGTDHGGHLGSWLPHIAVYLRNISKWESQRQITFLYCSLYDKQMCIDKAWKEIERFEKLC